MSSESVNSLVLSTVRAYIHVHILRNPSSTGQRMHDPSADATSPLATSTVSSAISGFSVVLTCDVRTERAWWVREEGKGWKRYAAPTATTAAPTATTAAPASAPIPTSTMSMLVRRRVSARLSQIKCASRKVRPPPTLVPVLGA